jgi:4-hydroxybenzoate polyprenyltransferase
VTRLAALARATHFAPTVAVTTFAVAVAVAAGRGVVGSLLVLLAVLAGQCSIGWANDWLDRERDRRSGRADKPIVAGAVDAGTVWAGARLALAACVPLSLASGLAAGAAHLVGVAAGWAYDLGLKSTVWSPLPYAVGFGSLPLFVALGLPSRAPAPWWAVAGAALLGAGAHFTNALPDLADDARTGVRGLPQRLGAGGCLVAAAVLLGAGTAVVTLGPGRPGPLRLTALVAGAVLSLAALAAGLTGRTRLAFPLTIATAAACVLSLISSADLLGG